MGKETQNVLFNNNQRTKSPFLKQQQYSSKLNQEVQFSHGSMLHKFEGKRYKSPIQTRKKGKLQINDASTPAQTSMNFNKQIKAEIFDQQQELIHNWAKRSTTTGNTRNNVKNKTQEFYQNQRSHHLPGNHAIGHKNHRGRIDQYGNFIEFKDIQASFLGMQRTTKEDQLPTETAEQDMKKFYGIGPQTRYNQEQTTSYITQSQQYKYKRIRDGGWGLKGPQNLADLPFISQNRVKQRESKFKGSQSVGSSQVWKNTHKITSQLLKQSTSEAMNQDSGTREDSIERANNSHLSDFAVKKSVIEYIQQKGNSALTNEKFKQTNSIFDSKDADELDQSSLSKHVMLQDSIDFDKQTYNVDQFEHQGVAPQKKGSMISTQKRFSQVKPTIGGYKNTVVKNSPNINKIVSIQNEVQKTQRQIKTKVGNINQYNSNSIGQDFEEATITLTSTIGRMGNNSQITSQSAQNQHQTQTKDRKMETTTGLNDSELYESIDKLAFENDDNKNVSLKHDSVMHYVEALEVNQQDFNKNESPRSNLYSNVNTKAFGTERSAIKQFLFQDKISITDSHGQNLKAIKPYNFQSQNKGPNVSVKYEMYNQTLNQSKRNNMANITKEQERVEKQSIFEKLSQGNTNRLLQSYAHQDMQSEKKQIRKQREKMLDVIKLMQQKIKEKKRQIEKQKEINLKEALQIKSQFTIFQRLNQLEAISLIYIKNQMQIPLDENKRQSNDFNLDNQVGTYLNSQHNSINQDSIYDLPTGKMRIDDSASAVIENQADITVLYKYLFETDLNLSKKKTLMQLYNVKGKKDAALEESEVIQAENEILKNIIKRYQKMIKQAEYNIQQGYPAAHAYNPGDSSPNSVLEINKFGTKKLSNSVKIAEIDEMMYKYQSNSYNNSPNVGAKSNFQIKGSVGGETPKINLGAGFQSQNRQTTMSFGMVRQPLHIEIRKAEQLNLSMLHISRSFKAIDSIVMLLSMVKTVLKAAKVCLFIIETELQERLFSNGQRKHNYRKILVGSTSVLSVFDTIQDFQDPIFRQIDQVSQVVNQKHILLPLWDADGSKIPQQCLQILYEEKQINKNVSKKSKQNGSYKRVSKSPGKQAVGNVRSRSNSASRISLSTQQKFGGVVGSVIQGWNQNDLSMAKLMSIFLQLNTDYFDMQVVKAQKQRKIKDVINFAIDMIQVRSYRQLVRGFSSNVQQLLGFTIGTVFFQNSQIVGNDHSCNHCKEDENLDTSFAKELYFPDDQIVIFPSSIGITGEVHHNMGFKIDNDFGQMVKKNKDKQMDEEFDLQSETSNISSNLMGRTSSLRNYAQQQLIGFKGAAHRKDTKLEHVLEEDPQAEHDMHFGNNTNQPMTKKNSVNDFTSEMSPQREYGGATSIARYRASLGQSPQQDKESINKDDLNFGNAVDQSLRQKKQSIKRALAPIEQSSVHGNILDLVSKRERKMSQAKNGDRERSKSNCKHVKSSAQKYFQPFVPDIDNFVGVKQVKNYCLIALKDNGYCIGERSVGVLQLYNKIDGRRINKEDLARIQSLSRFIGALSQKAQDITNSLTLVIGMTQRIKQANYEIYQVDTTPGLGIYQSMMIPTETIIKTIEIEEKMQKDQQEYEQTLRNNSNL